MSLLHFTSRYDTLLIAMPDHVIRILLRGVPVLVRKKGLLSLFLPLPSSVWCPLPSPTATLWKLQSLLLSFLHTVLRVQEAAKPQASLRAISGPCVPHYVVFVHPQNHFQSPSSIYHPCPRSNNVSN